MSLSKKEIISALEFRYAVQVFDTNKKIPAEDLRVILESARLAPSSIGLEAWQFIVVEDTVLREKILEAAFGQSKVTEASHLVILTYRTDHQNLAEERLLRTAKAQNDTIENLGGLRALAENGIANAVSNGSYTAWAKAQTYIPLGIMMETASLLGIDNAAMEGFDPDKVNSILGLSEKNLEAATMLALGYRGNDPTAVRQKTRRSFDEVVTFL